MSIEGRPTGSQHPATLAKRAVRDLDHPAMGLAEKAVLGAIAERLNADGWAWASLERLAKDTGASRSTVASVFAWLRDPVRVVVVDVDAGRRSLTYGIDMARLGSLPADLPMRTDGRGRRHRNPPRKASSPSAWRNIRRIVLQRDAFACRYCGASADLTVDHIVPRSRGGSHYVDNLVVACRRCNSSKGKRTPGEAGMVLREVP